MAEAANNGEEHEAWNWPEMLFCARKFLNITSEAEFWRMRPRTYFALLSIAIKYQGAKSTSQAPASNMTTIDNIPGF